MDVTETVLFKDYNTYRFHTNHIYQQQRQGRYVRSLKPTKQRLAKFARLAQWCWNHGFDSRLWLYSLFQARKWLYAPRLDHLCSESHIPKFKGLSEFTAYSQRVTDEIREADEVGGAVYHRDRDISHTAEIVKRRYLLQGDVDRCIAEMDETTFGYHPKSRSCQRCPQAEHCAQVLQATKPFDIVALRNGTMTFQQARQIAGFNGGQRRW